MSSSFVSSSVVQARSIVNQQISDFHFKSIFSTIRKLYDQNNGRASSLNHEFLACLPHLSDLNKLLDNRIPSWRREF